MNPFTVVKDGVIFKIPNTQHKYEALIEPRLWNKHHPPVTSIQRVRFGDRDYEQYKDRIGYWRDQDHLDKKRRDNYRKRHGGIMVNGTPSYRVKYSPAYFSRKYLW
jgi:hypothetical protein